MSMKLTFFVARNEVVLAILNGRTTGTNVEVGGVTATRHDYLVDHCPEGADGMWFYQNASYAGGEISVAGATIHRAPEEG